MIKDIDEIKAELEQKNRQLEACNQRFRTIMTKSLRGILIVDMGKTVRFVNPAAAAIFGCKAEELTGSRFDYPIEPDRTAELQMKTREGKTVIVEMWSSETEWDACRAWFVSLHDITERRRMEEALRESEERFRATFNQAAVGIGHVAPDGRWLRINQKYCDITGYSEEELEALTIRDITHPDDRETSMKHFHLLLKGKLDNYSLEKRYIRKDGSTIWVNLIASMVSDARGKPRFAMGVVEDITPRKRAEDEIKTTSRQKELILKSAGEGILGLDMEGKHTFVNSSAAAMLGYDVNELIGKNSHAMWHHTKPDGSLYPAEECPVFAAYKDGTVHSGKEMFWRKDGTGFPVAFISRPILSDGKTVGAVLTFNDITERKRMEEEIERLNTDLAARAVEQEAANRELESFNYTVAHDLRNPLNLVSSYCQVLMELCCDKLDEQCRRYLQETYDGTVRMNRLIEALLNFSRLAHVETHRETVDLSAIAHEIAAELQLSEPERRVTFRIADGVSADGDAALLRVVMDNLFGNAWKYNGMRDEGIIEFGTTLVDGKPAHFVRDNGTGFDMAYADKLFAPFQRLPGSEECRGFGIGLATVERIIRRLGGRVWAEGEPGKGATFWFTLGNG